MEWKEYARAWIKEEQEVDKIRFGELGLDIKRRPELEELFEI